MVRIFVKIASNLNSQQFFATVKKIKQCRISTMRTFHSRIEISTSTTCLNMCYSFGLYHSKEIASAILKTDVRIENSWFI